MKNKVMWKDIVLIKGNYFVETIDVEFEDEKLVDIEFPNTEQEILDKLKERGISPTCDIIYNCDKFFEDIAEKYNVEIDDITTYMFDNINIPKEILDILPCGIELCGGYINGFNI